MKIRKSILKKYTTKEIIDLGTTGIKNIIKNYDLNTLGHQMETEVDIKGNRNVELNFKNIICELDGYEKETKTATEIKSNFGSKNEAEIRNFRAILEIYALQNLTNCKKINDYIMISINSKITKKYGMDYSIISYSKKDFETKKMIKIRGHIKTEKDFLYEYEEAFEKARKLIQKMNEINEVK